jgi:putative Holliday junction resolvase
MISMRYLGIDLGDKRTGIALGDDETKLVSPIDVVIAPRTSDALMQGLLKVIDQQRPHALVIGLPLNMDGTEGAAAKAAREFGEQLSVKSNLPVHVQDERLTSYAADQRMAQTGRTHKQKKELRDALAAAEILRDFFDRTNGPGIPGAKC